MHKIIDIKSKDIKRTVYNIEVENTHNFFVGNQELLVHNVRRSLGHIYK